MSARFSFSLHKFGPTRAEEITGVARVTQRDWRREGHLPSSEGMARYDLYDLCELWVLKACADAGLGPKRAKAFSRDCALHIAWHCLRLIGTYEGDHLRAPFSRLEKTFEHRGETFPVPPWGRKSRWLADHIMYGKDELQAASEYYGLWPDGEAKPEDKFGHMFVIGEFLKQKRGLVSILPLSHAARWLVDAAGEPLVEVAFGGPK